MSGASADGSGKPVVLCVDDDPSVLRALQQILESGGLATRAAPTPRTALELLDDLVPDLVLLDVKMPEMDGYELCRRILDRPGLSHVPILFVTAFSDEEDRARARKAGGTLLMAKPVERDVLLRTVRDALGMEADGKEASLPEPGGTWADWAHPGTFDRFRGYLQARLSLGSRERETLQTLEARDLYGIAAEIGVRPSEIARNVAEFLAVPYVASVDPEHVDLGLLTGPFCKANFILPVREEGRLSVILSNPFDWQLLETVQRVARSGGEPEILISEPENIRLFFTRRELQRGDPERGEDRNQPPVIDVDRPSEGPPRDIETLSNQILRQAILDGASDLHLEPKVDRAVVRLRIDGDLTDVRDLTPAEGTMLIARYKALGRLDIAEKRKPQDGSMEAVVAGLRYKLRLATTATPHGESLVVRILNPGAAPPSLRELGMTSSQADVLAEMAQRSQGLILVVGPTGSGKSTTIFSLLSHFSESRRSVITVEDPVEYEMPFANQQQVNERAGATFEALLRSAVRQDPDVLLIGEVRDPFSAKAAMDFSSSGHLTVSTIHSSNATTAIFRLERLGVERGAMADAIVCIVAQKLLKRLCDRCRRVRPITEEERGWLALFADEVPERVAEPVGCPACRDTGYRGREAVVEILAMDPTVRDLVRESRSISEIRRFVADRGDLLLPGHAVEKVREHVLSPRDAHRLVLVEESVGPGSAPAAPVEQDVGRDGGAGAAAPGPIPGEAPSILVVEDDQDARTLLERLLTNVGYRVTLAEDGVAALLELGRTPFDLILSDINMPNLDGLKLVEVLQQSDIDAPVIFLTSQTDEHHEARGLGLGAVDYLHKPVRKQILRMRIAKALGEAAGWTPAGDDTPEENGGPEQ